MRPRFIAGVAVALVLASTIPRTASAQPVEEQGLRRSISDNGRRADRLHTQILKLIDEKNKALLEMRAGAFCSGCDRTRSDILASGERFPHEGERAIAATPGQLAAKAREYDEQINALKRELSDLDASTQRMIGQARQAQYEANQAKLRADQAAQKQRLDESNARLKTQFDDIQKALSGLKLRATPDNAAEVQRLEAQQQTVVRAAAEESSRYRAVMAQRPEVPELPPGTGGDVALGTSSLSPDQLAEQSRLSELATAGLVSAPPAFSPDAIQVAADKVASLADRAFNVKDAFDETKDAAVRVAEGDRPDFVRRVQMLAETVGDQRTLIADVIDPLPSMVDALAQGDTGRQAAIVAQVDTATEAFRGAMESRAKEASPEYALTKATVGLRDSVDALTAPIEMPASPEARAKLYVDVAKRAADAAYDARKSKEPEGDPVPAGPKVRDPVEELIALGQATAESSVKEAATVTAEAVVARTLRPDTARVIGSPSATIRTAASPIELYRVARTVNGQTVNFWSRTPPVDAEQAAKTFRIRLPAGREYIEEMSSELLYLENFDPAWVAR